MYKLCLNSSYLSVNMSIDILDRDNKNVLVFIDIAAAGYNLIQLVIRCMLISSPQKQDMRGSYKHLAWFSFLLDQVRSTSTYFCQTNT
ncbi:hypothetical protein Hanom_Chr12g01072721 [Helianthus anomalus]